MISKLLKKDKKGFTLMEMLIVVAIIAIIVAIAIPTFSNALTKAKVAADKANVRAYYAEVAANYMLAEDETAATAALGTAVTDATDLTVSGTAVKMQAGKYTVEIDTTTNHTWTITYTANSANQNKYPPLTLTLNIG